MKFEELFNRLIDSQYFIYEEEIKFNTESKKSPTEELSQGVSWMESDESFWPVTLFFDKPPYNPRKKTKNVTVIFRRPAVFLNGKKENTTEVMFYIEHRPIGIYNGIYKLEVLTPKEFFSIISEYDDVAEDLIEILPRLIIDGSFEL